MASTILALLSSAITAILTWLISRQKSKAEIKKIQADTDTIQLSNLTALINIYKTISGDLTRELQQLREQMQELQTENKQLRLQIKHLEETLNYVKLQTKTHEDLIISDAVGITAKLV